MTRGLTITGGLIEAIVGAARRAHPHECCGLIEGAVTADGWCAAAIHETKNLAEDPARNFLVDPEAHFRLLRSLRGTGREIIGCFHSHPGGPPEPSERDRAQAIDDGFLWLVAGADGEVSAFVFGAAGARFAPVTVRQTV